MIPDVGTLTAKPVTRAHAIVVVPILLMIDVGTLRKPVTMLDVGTLRKPVTMLDIGTLRKPVTMLYTVVVVPILDVGTHKAKPVTNMYSYTYDTGVAVGVQASMFDGVVRAS